MTTETDTNPPIPIRLQRMIQKSLSVAPEPDWSTAPEWAQWWAVNSDGAAMWYEHKPHLVHVTHSVFGGFMTWVPEGGQGKWDRSSNVTMSLPVGLDWRLFRYQRPQPHVELPAGGAE
jgi:hypothetical protein